MKGFPLISSALVLYGVIITTCKGGVVSKFSRGADLAIYVSLPQYMAVRC